MFVLYTLHTGRIWSYTWHGKIWFAAALCEVLFSVHHFLMVRSISGPSPNGPGHLDELQAAFTRVLKAGLAGLSEDDRDEETLDVDRPGSPAENIVQLKASNPHAIDFRNYMRTWFRKARWSSIRTQELYSWLYWSIYNTSLPPLENLPPAHRVTLDDALSLIEKRSGTTIPQGSDPTTRPILLTLDKVNVHWRPLFWYVFVAASNCYQRWWLMRTWDVRFGCYNGLEYFIRIPKSWDPASGPRPIVFWHGLGLGLTQYQVFLSHHLRAFPDRPFLVPLQPHISQEIFHSKFLKPMGRHETTACVVGLLRELGWVSQKDKYTTDTESEPEEASLGKSSRKGVVMLSHSNGSYAHTWMLKSYPQMVVRSCFVDPVTFCSWEGDVCYNFLYRQCTTGMELLMRYFVGTELGVANLLQRHFDWSSNALWYEEIPNARDPSKTMFLLGGKDAIVEAERVKRYLRSHGVRKGLYFDPDGRHGQALTAGGAGHAAIMEWLKGN
ncbi:hypothetical protein SERLA73DRAFT_177462, partial [Serpula lacrymans var. lacrymans S7.3]